MTDLCPPMIYSITWPPIFINWSVSITSISWFVIGQWIFIIIDFTPIHQKIIYILYSCWMYRSINFIWIKLHPPFIFLLFDVLKICEHDTYVSNITHLWTQWNYLSLKYTCFMKIQSCYLLVTLLNSLWVIKISLRALRLSLLLYLSTINLSGWR